jgi:hypothetical protein
MTGGRSSFLRQPEHTIDHTATAGLYLGTQAVAGHELIVAQNDMRFSQRLH